MIGHVVLSSNPKRHGNSSDHDFAVYSSNKVSAMLFPFVSTTQGASGRAKEDEIRRVIAATKITMTGGNRRCNSRLPFVKTCHLNFHR
jgi:hypothetical protein